MLIYEAGRYNIKGKQFLSTQSKYYVVDVGMRNALVKSSESDIGHILENIVYLELKRRYKNVICRRDRFQVRLTLYQLMTINMNTIRCLQLHLMKTH